MDMKGYVKARPRVKLTPGESVRTIRELQELSQAELGRLSDLPQSTISAIESGRVKLGAERAKKLAVALQCHPAALLFPGWELTPPTVA